MSLPDSSAPDEPHPADGPALPPTPAPPPVRYDALAELAWRAARRLARMTRVDAPPPGPEGEALIRTLLTILADWEARRLPPWQHRLHPHGPPASAREERRRAVLARILEDMERVLARPWLPALVERYIDALDYPRLRAILPDQNVSRYLKPTGWGLATLKTTLRALFAAGQFGPNSVSSAPRRRPDNTR